MSTQEVSFAIEGMFCANCAVKIEHALTQLNGVVAAHVNYASERARVVYDPTRLSGTAMVDAVRREGFDVRMRRVALDVDGLLYATSRRFIETILRRTPGVSDVSIDLGTERVEIDAFADDSSPGNIQRTLGRLGFIATHLTNSRLGFNTQPLDGVEAVSAIYETSSTKIPPTKSIRRFVAQTVVATLLALLIAMSAGEHLGWLPAIGVIHLPLMAMALGMVALFATGLPFYHFAFDAALQGELDAGVLIALVSSALSLVGIPLALIAPTTWLTGIAFVIATTLLAGWFLVRAITALVLPQISRRRPADAESTASQAQLKTVSDGTGN